MSLRCFADFGWVVWLRGDESSGVSIAADAHGNSFVAGSFFGTVTIGTNVLNSAGGKDLFIAKIDPRGAVSWAISAGGTNDDSAKTILADANGNVFVTGALSAGGRFGNVSLETNENSGAFLARITRQGVVDWLRFLPDAVVGAAYLDDRMLWLVGSTNGTASMFLSSWTARGQESKRNLIAYGGEASGIAMDRAGDIYVAGHYNGRISFENVTLSLLRRNAFVAKFDQDGRCQWATNCFNGFFSFAKGIAVARDGTASTVGSVDYPFGSSPTFGGYSLGLFLTQHSSSGEKLGVGLLGEYKGRYEGNGVALDRHRNVYLVGFAVGSDQQPDHRRAALIDGPGFSYRIKSEWPTDGNSANAITVDSDGYAYVTGDFMGAAPFGSFTVSAGDRGLSHAFIARLDDATPRKGRGSASRR